MSGYNEPSSDSEDDPMNSPLPSSRSRLGSPRSPTRPGMASGSGLQNTPTGRPAPSYAGAAGGQGRGHRGQRRSLFGAPGAQASTSQRFPRGQSPREMQAIHSPAQLPSGLGMRTPTHRGRLSSGGSGMRTPENRGQLSGGSGMRTPGNRGQFSGGSGMRTPTDRGIPRGGPPRARNSQSMFARPGNMSRRHATTPSPYSSQDDEGMGGSPEAATPPPSPWRPYKPYVPRGGQGGGRGGGGQGRPRLFEGGYPSGLGASTSRQGGHSSGFSAHGVAWDRNSRREQTFDQFGPPPVHEPRPPYDHENPGKHALFNPPSPINSSDDEGQIQETPKGGALNLSAVRGRRLFQFSSSSSSADEEQGPSGWAGPSGASGAAGQSGSPNGTAMHQTPQQGRGGGRGRGDPMQRRRLFEDPIPSGEEEGSPNGSPPNPQLDQTPRGRGGGMRGRGRGRGDPMQQRRLFEDPNPSSDED